MSDESTFSIADLPGSLLGLTRAGKVLIDRNAAGRGWFVDPTPEDEDEFALAQGRAVAPAAMGRIDLLTVVLHELGICWDWSTTMGSRPRTIY